MALYSQSQQQYLLAAINKQNPNAALPADLSNCIIGKPRVIAQKLPTDPNTEVTIRGRQRRGYNGSRTFQYTRLSLSDLFKGITPIITLPGISRMQQAVKNLNGRYGLNLLEEEIVNYVVYNQQYQTLVTNGESLQWVGSVRCRYIAGRYDLEELVMNNILDVMKHPIDLDNKKLCSTMLGFGVDFSDEKVFLLSMSTGSLSAGANFTSGRSKALQDMMLSRGLPAWDMTNAKAQVIRPTQDTRAKTTYDRVLLVTNVNDVNVEGDWLLHFNI